MNIDKKLELLVKRFGNISIISSRSNNKPSWIVESYHNDDFITSEESSFTLAIDECMKFNNIVID